MIKLSDLKKGDIIELANGKKFEALLDKKITELSIPQVFVRINPDKNDKNVFITSYQLNEDFSLKDIYEQNDKEDYIKVVHIRDIATEVLTEEEYEVKNKKRSERHKKDNDISIEEMIDKLMDFAEEKYKELKETGADDEDLEINIKELRSSYKKFKDIEKIKGLEKIIKEVFEEYED